MESKTRGAKYKEPIKEKNEKTAEKIAQLLAESKTTFSDVDTIFRLTKEKLKVTC